MKVQSLRYILGLPFFPVRSQWQPWREPFHSTLLRTGFIAIAVGAVLARLSGGWTRWPAFTLSVLWPSFGGHWLEVWFLNWLRPRLPRELVFQVAGRVIVWFGGGAALLFLMGWTAAAIGGVRLQRWPSWWIAGAGFVAIELVVHLFPRLRGRPSFYDGRG